MWVGGYVCVQIAFSSWIHKWQTLILLYTDDVDIYR